MENNVEIFEENNINNKKNNNKGLLIGLIICIIIIICLSGYICYDKVLSNKTDADKSSLNSAIKKVDDEEKKDVKEDKEDENGGNEKSKENTSYSVIYPTNTRKCTGTYYGEASGTQSNGLSYNYKQTYTLNDDGTFELAGGIASTKGVYVILENTISLIGLKHTTGPADQDPMYMSEDYVMARDCSYILINDGNVSFKAMRK